jgi:DNA-binding transcriptional ArsR family regulator
MKMFDVLPAIGDPTRRRLLDMLSRGDLAASAIASAKRALQTFPRKRAPPRSKEVKSLGGGRAVGAASMRLTL